MNATSGDADREFDAMDTRLMEASEWVMRLQGREADEHTTAQWLEWCQADRGNLAAFESVRTLWSRFDDPRLNTSLAAGALSRHSNEALSRGAGFRGRAGVFWALAASILVTLGIVSWFSRRDVATAPYSQTLRTAVGSLRRQTLPDGSTVELGARSALRVRLTSVRRNIFIDNGEAFFKVAKDPGRPFVVQAGPLQVVAVGTAFNVRKSADRIVVTVKEGAVRVAPGAATDAANQTGTSALVPTESSDGQVRAGAGHQVTYLMRQHALTMTTIKPAAVSVVAWQVGRLEFVDEPLGSVLADINRYSRRPITLADEQLGTLVFTGTVRSDAIDDWLRGIEAVFPIKVIDGGEQGIVLADSAH